MTTLSTWIRAERGRAAALSKELGVCTTFIHKIMRGEKPPPVARAAHIERFTAGEVTRKEMFPDTWAEIWPELSKKKAGVA